MRLTIEKLVYGGEGLARATEDAQAKTIFVPFVLPGEVVEAQLTEQKKSFAHARLEAIVTASPLRVAPPCPYFLTCGGCHYQHMSYLQQVEAKKTILLETLRRTGKIEWTKPVEAITAEPLHYRNRTRMRVHHTGKFEIGYYAYRSHKLIAVRECPISSHLINQALAQLWKRGEAGEFPPPVREVEFFANAGDSQLLMELNLHVAPSAEDKKQLTQFVAAVMADLPAFVGAAAFAQQGDSADYSTPLWTNGQTSLEYKTSTGTYRVSAGSFFQTNRFLSDSLVEVVTRGARGGLALDLYAGTGLFSLPLARSFDQVVAVEASPASFGDLRANAAENMKVVRSTTEDFLRQTGGKHAPDLIVVDPPRAGLGEQVVPILGRSKSGKLCYVSCDPATLARDLKALIEAGYGIDTIHLVDLF
ncbi:MAG TPA: class I SAM-dependent RNA methyltransferase, partial [Terriglobales bacterium]|nr:class I SAM-dependent RNA methyltransferase [Terriglobales bacterium]